MRKTRLARLSHALQKLAGGVSEQEYLAIVRSAVAIADPATNSAGFHREVPRQLRALDANRPRGDIGHKDSERSTGTTEITRLRRSWGLGAVDAFSGTLPRQGVDDALAYAAGRVEGTSWREQGLDLQEMLRKNRLPYRAGEASG